MANYNRVANVFGSGSVGSARMSRVALALLILICMQSVGAKSAWGQGNPQSRSVKEILADTQLWGKDFPTVLASISSWKQIDQRIVIFPARVLGDTPYRTSAEAARTGAILNNLLRPNDKLRASVLPWVEDGSFRVAVDGGALELLPRDFSLETVKKHLGTPERTTTVVITGKTEHRPTVLLLYSYAHGAVVYAESAYSPFPGRIDRVFLDLNIPG
jgi:hypothetical protein